MLKRSIVLTIIILSLTAGAVQAQQYNQSPILDKLVESGQLPPVEDRLPANPRVLKVTEDIGKYGGVLNLIHSWVGQDPQLRMINSEFLLESFPRSGMDEGKIESNVLESYEVNHDGTVYTLKIREGLKWSDGVPVTTEDARYAFEDVLLNEKLTAWYPGWLQIGGKPPELEIIDEYTFRFTFAEPYGLFTLMMQSHLAEYSELILPSHYLKKFHIEYTSLEDMQPYLKEEGLDEDEWWNLHSVKNKSSAWNLDAPVGFPTLHPYVVVERPSDSVTILERNPYYFKVDEEGNQLPYIDRIRMELVQDQEMKNMKIIAGEVDFECGAGGLALTNLPLYRENETRGGYRTLLLDSTGIVTPAIYFPNLTNPDEVLRGILQDARFRQALSLAINREEINDLVFFGLGEPAQATDIKGSPYWQEEFEKAFAEYDPDRANRLLDAMGLNKRDEDGWRLRPDGKVLTIPLDFFEVNANVLPVSELVVEYWRDVGIKADMKLISNTLWIERQVANENVMSVWHQEAVSADALFGWFAPVAFRFAPLWHIWYTSGGHDGTEPPMEVQRVFYLYDQIRSTPHERERIVAGREILQVQSEKLWTIGTVTRVPAVTIVSERLRNIPDWSICTQWGLPLGEQIYFGD